MAAVNIILGVETRAGSPTLHNQEVDKSDDFQLTTTTSAYTTDLPAFSTTVYNYYAAQLGTANVASVDVLYKLWIGGDATGGGVETADGVIAAPANAAAITAQLSALINEIIVKANPSNV